MSSYGVTNPVGNEKLLDLQPYLQYSLSTAQILVLERHFGQVVGGPLYSARQHSLNEHATLITEGS